MWSKIYPVGAIYISTSPTSPQTLFGGTWEAITGRFLVAQGSNGQSGNAALNLSAGVTGGETNHQLTVNEMPQHNHEFGSNQNGKYRAAILSSINSSPPQSFVNSLFSTGSGSTRSFTLSDNASSHAIDNTDSAGMGTAHNNLPPYLSVYMWKRTA